VWKLLLSLCGNIIRLLHAASTATTHAPNRRPQLPAKPGTAAAVAKTPTPPPSPQSHASRRRRLLSLFAPRYRWTSCKK